MLNILEDLRRYVPLDHSIGSLSYDVKIQELSTLIYFISTYIKRPDINPIFLDKNIVTYG